MKYAVVEQKTQEQLCFLEIDCKPGITECIIHDGLPYQIGNIVYFDCNDEWMAILLVCRVAEMKIGKGGDLYEGQNLDQLFKQLFGL